MARKRERRGEGSVPENRETHAVTHRESRAERVSRRVNIFYLLTAANTREGVREREEEKARGYILPRCGLLYTAYRYLCVAALPKRLIYEL